jgi:hypothetical protein
MSDILMATFDDLKTTEKAAQLLCEKGAVDGDVCALESQGPEAPHDCGLVAVRVGPGHIAKETAESVIVQTGGHALNDYGESQDAQEIVRGLPQAKDPYKSPESYLPPILMEALRNVSMRRRADGLQPQFPYWILQKPRRLTA